MYVVIILDAIIINTYNINWILFRDAMSVSFGHNCLHLTFLITLSSETYSCKYEKLPNVVIYACKNITEKKNMCGT